MSHRSLTVTWLIGFVCLVVANGAAFSQTKIEAELYKQLRSSNKVHVIILTKADPDQATGGASITNATSYISGRLGVTATNVRSLGKIAGVSAEITADALERLRDDPNVALVTRDIPVPPLLFDSVPMMGADQYHARNIRGTGFNVAVLDTGVDTSHPALGKSVITEACFSTAKSSQFKIKSLCPQGFDAFLQTGAAGQCPRDLEGCDHGTHVAGIIAGHNMATPGHSFGGVAPAAGIVAVQVFTLFEDPVACGGVPRCVQSFTSDQLRALEWVFRRRAELKIAAINMSLGGGYHDSPCDSISPLTEIIERLRGKQIATVIAAGNETFFDGISEPACISHAISVSALRHDGQLDVSYSNVAPFVTIAAPGTDITSSVFKAKYGLKSGTSMAAPHVAATFALLRQQQPERTITELVKLLKDASAPVADPRTGTVVGRIDLASLAPPDDTRVATRGAGKSTAVVRAASKRSVPAEEQPGPSTTTAGSEQSRMSGGSYIVKTSKPAADIKAILDQQCKDHVCQVKQIGTDAYKIDISPQPSSETRGGKPPAVLDRTELGKMLGDGVKIYDNRLSRPSK